MGLMICGFGGLVLLRWQWFDSVFFLVAGCLIRWGFYMKFMSTTAGELAGEVEKR